MSGARNVGIKRDGSGRPATNEHRGIVVGPHTDGRGGQWRCDKRNPPLVVDGVKHCPDCGRRIAERFKVTDTRFPPEYKRSHVGLWSTWTGC